MDQKASPVDWRGCSHLNESLTARGRFAPPWLSRAPEALEWVLE